MARFYGVSPSTIRRWEALGLIPKSIRTFGGHRRFPQPNRLATHSSRRIELGYARVSSSDQKKDLTRQAAVLGDVGCTQVITDLGSGLNCKKPGLKKLIRLLLEGKVARLTVTHEDRLLRFGVPLIRQLCKHTNTQIRVLRCSAPISFEAELAKDVITLMTVFCARLYGRRAHKNKPNKRLNTP